MSQIQTFSINRFTNVSKVQNNSRSMKMEEGKIDPAHLKIKSC